MSTISNPASGGSTGGPTAPSATEPLSVRAGTWPAFLSKQACTAEPDFNRWAILPAAMLVQGSVGSVYAWSVWNAPLTTSLGVAASSSSDWALGETLWTFTLAACTLGMTTFFLGPWAERAGPRYVSTVSALSYSSGFAVSALAVKLHSLPLLYCGAGVLGGLGWGLGYISPVSTLLRWFPDRRGMAAGLGLMSFGGGAAVGAPAIEYFVRRNFVAPTRLEEAFAALVETRNGVQFLGDQEVVFATKADLGRLAVELQEGFFIVGSGDSGVMMAFLTMAGIYGGAMLSGASLMRIPPPDYLQRMAAHVPQSVLEEKSVHYRQALQTPQFYLLWLALCGNVSGGMAILSSAKTIMTETFGSAFPAIVGAQFATGFVVALSAHNAAGRITWATASDWLGRKNTYAMFGVVGTPLVLSLPLLTSMAAESGNEMLLYSFYGGTCLAMTFYGGTFAVLPAYIADLFGDKYVGAIHGRVLTAWAMSSLIGPPLLSTLRWRSYQEFCTDLAGKASDADFATAFGASKEALPILLEKKTVTIQRLLEICPAGTPDPSMQLYDTTFCAIGGLLTVAALSNAMITKVDASHLEGVELIRAMPTPDTGAGRIAADKLVDLDELRSEEVKEAQEHSWRAEEEKRTP